MATIPFGILRFVRRFKAASVSEKHAKADIA